jgi:2-methylcitrate dehydratase PrpD
LKLTAPTGDYLDRLARFVAETPAEHIAPEVLERTRHILVDTLPVIAWGMREPQPSALAQRQLAGQPSAGGAWVIGAGRTGAALDAAMLNGIAGAWLDFDEGNFLANGHPGVQVIPAALAVAQERRMSGRELLTTIALAYEVVARIGMATQTKLIINPHGTFGVVGSALACARLMRVPADSLRNLASLAASCCMATNRHTMLDGATVRNWYAGHSGTMGQMAVRMALSGFSGPKDGVNSTFSLVLGDGFSPEVAVQDLGQRWLLCEGYLKLYPTARYVHSAIDALHDALARAGRQVAAGEVARIDVRAYSLAAYLAGQAPRDWFGTRFSIPFALATLLVGGRRGLDAFSDEAVADPAIQALAARIHVVEDESFTRKYPRLQRVDLCMQLQDGSRIDGACHITSGEPSRPHAQADLDRKYEDLAVPLWGAERAHQLKAALMNIERCTDVSALVDFLP